MSDTYSGVERRIQQALESTPVITDFARKYDVPIIVFTQGLMEFLQNRRFSDIEEKALCRYLDRLDKLGLPVQRELFSRGGGLLS
jgi:hypothetical protein